MERQVVIDDILRYREDIGQGVRTGVLFGGCGGSCSRVCWEYPGSKPRFHTLYTPETLFERLVREDHEYLSKKVNVTLLGKDPMLSPGFCRELILRLKEAGLETDVYSCLLGREESLFELHGLVHLYIFSYLTVSPGRYRRVSPHDHKKLLETLRCADATGAPYRLRFPVIRGFNEDEAESFAIIAASLKHVKSVILDFRLSGLTPAQQDDFRAPFRDRGLILY